jgi:acyl-CoA synthetase (AMP-forming)/AMP-acid ligase II
MKAALVYKNKTYTYDDLSKLILEWEDKIENIPAGSIVMIESSFNPDSIALLFALSQKNCIMVLCSKYSKEFIEISQPEYIISNSIITECGINNNPNKYYQKLRELKHPGLVAFSSGSTGKNKGIVHDFNHILEKFKIKGREYCTLLFLLFDHLGGINTLLYTLYNKGCAVIPDDFSVSTVLGLIEAYKVELLPTTPSFLNMMILSGEHKKHDLSSLKLITYGTEPMLESVLKVMNQDFPNIKLQQTYGLTEFGVFRSKSLSNDSLLVKIGGEGVETKIVDGTLHIKSKTAMLGYINEPNPFDEDGWMDTHDKVVPEGEYFRILGRDSDIINVGGLKVYPSEIESVIAEMEGVDDVLIYSKANKLVGNIVCARVKISEGTEAKDFHLKLKRFCRERGLSKYKIPMEVDVVSHNLYTDRFKKPRTVHDK